ncbi:MAG: efflux RND transporter periplasmic adaptor subunit [Gemmatimonadetes bacterium]|nr:efflux RND transporter periplasmic adaptor subunit [Gemmatimonadota bacterium]
MKQRLAASALLVLTAACSTGESAPVSAFQTTTAMRGDLRITAEATGTVEPIRTVEVKSRAGGEILEMLVDVGDEVEPGTLLARVDPRDVRNAYDQAEADLAVARASMENARAQFERNQQLLDAGVITQQEFEQSNLQYANAQASLTRAETNFELAELRLNDVTIRAPLAGTILTRNVEEGSVIQSASGNVSGGSTLFTMAALASMRVRTLVDETDMGDLQAGMVATVTVEAYPDQTFRGEIEKIEPQAVVQQNVTMFPVIVSLDNSSGLLKSGMNAEVEILIDQANDVVLIPNNTVVTMQDAVAAAAALGLDPETIDVESMRAPQPAAAEGAQGAPAAAAGAMNRDSIRARMQRGEMSQDELRSMMASLRGGQQGGATADPMAPRPAVVFVMNAEGQPEPKAISIALNDWDNTQVVAGLEDGVEIAVIGAVQLQAAQAERLEQMRSRFGGGGPFPSGRR